MTRVEKYHRYREEILNTKTVNESSKKEASNIVKKVNSNNSSSLSYDQVLNAFEQTSEKKTNINKLLIVLLSVSVVVIITLVILLIVK